MVDRIKTRLVLDEAGLFLYVPIQIEIEYELEDDLRVHFASMSKKVYLNRPLLLKECPGRSETELDRLVGTVQRAIKNHFSIQRCLFEKV